MFDINALDDMTADIIAAEREIRKTINMPDGIQNPARIIAALTGLSRAASSAAQAMAFIMASKADMDALEARISERSKAEA